MRPRTFAAFCEQFTSKPLSDVVTIGKRYFHDPEHLLAHADKHWDIFSVGVYLGEEKNEFHPTTALIELLAEHCEREVVINAKAAWLFICGRDVLMHGVVRADDDGIVIIKDEEGVVLGYGKIMCKYDAQAKNKLFVKNLLDRGEYLRRER